MEASQAGLGGDGGQAQQGGEGEGQQQQGPDLGALQEQLGAVGSNMEQMYQYLQSEPWRQGEPEAQEPEAQEEPLNYDFLQTGDPQYDQELATSLQNLIQHGSQQEIQRALQNELAPLREQVQEFQIEYKARELANEFPELNEEETANRVIAFSKQRAAALGQPELANSPDFWRESYLLGRAMQAMQEEQQAGEQSVAHLEGGGGAGAGQTQQVNPVDLIMNPDSDDGLGARVLNFGN